MGEAISEQHLLLIMWMRRYRTRSDGADWDTCPAISGSIRSHIWSAISWRTMTGRDSR